MSTVRFASSCLRRLLAIIHTRQATMDSYNKRTQCYHPPEKGGGIPSFFAKLLLLLFLSTAQTRRDLSFFWIFPFG